MYRSVVQKEIVGLNEIGLGSGLWKGVESTCGRSYVDLGSV